MSEFHFFGEPVSFQVVIFDGLCPMNSRLLKLLLIVFDKICFFLFLSSMHFVDSPLFVLFFEFFREHPGLFCRHILTSFLVFYHLPEGFFEMGFNFIGISTVLESAHPIELNLRYQLYGFYNLKVDFLNK
jgi:hypothetical protein